MHFPNTGDGGPYARFDGRTGEMILSAEDGGQRNVPSVGKVLSLDLKNAVQGWMRVAQAGFDFQPLAQVDVWSDAPSPDHKPGVDLDVYSDDPDFAPHVKRNCRGNSIAFTKFVESVCNAVGPDIPADIIPTIRITSCDRVSVGAGTSTDIRFELAPREHWRRREAEATSPPPSEPPAAAPALPSGDAPAAGSANW